MSLGDVHSEQKREEQIISGPGLIKEYQSYSHMNTEQIPLANSAKKGRRVVSLIVMDYLYGSIRIMKLTVMTSDHVMMLPSRISKHDVHLDCNGARGATSFGPEPKQMADGPTIEQNYHDAVLMEHIMCFYGSTWSNHHCFAFLPQLFSFMQTTLNVAKNIYPTSSDIPRYPSLLITRNCLHSSSNSHPPNSSLPRMI